MRHGSDPIDAVQFLAYSGPNCNNMRGVDLDRREVGYDRRGGITSAA